MQDATHPRPQLALLLDLTAFSDAGANLLDGATRSQQTCSGANDLNLVHIAASDLQQARTVRSRLRSEAHRRGWDTNAFVATLTVQILIDDNYGAALHAYAEARHDIDGNVLTYVGTVSGLQSLISDAYVAEAADAFLLKPLQWSPTIDLIANEVGPGLGADGHIRHSLAAASPPARRRVASPQRLSNSTNRPANFTVLTRDNLTLARFDELVRNGHGGRTPVGERYLVTA